MVRIPPFQGGGSCSIHGSCKLLLLFVLFALLPYWVFIYLSILEKSPSKTPTRTPTRGKGGEFTCHVYVLSIHYSSIFGDLENLSAWCGWRGKVGAWRWSRVDSAYARVFGAASANYQERPRDRETWICILLVLDIYSIPSGELFLNLGSQWWVVFIRTANWDEEEEEKEEKKTQTMPVCIFRGEVDWLMDSLVWDSLKWGPKMPQWFVHFITDWLITYDIG